MGKAKWALVLVVVVLAMLQLACDLDVDQEVEAALGELEGAVEDLDQAIGEIEDVIEDLPRVGDAMKIGERLEQVTCEAAWGLMFDWLEATQEPVYQVGVAVYTVQLEGPEGPLPLMVMRRSVFDRCAFVLW